MGLGALWHVASSQTRGRTCVPGIGRRILNHCATREVPPAILIQRRKTFWSQLSNLHMAVVLLPSFPILRTLDGALFPSVTITFEVFCLFVLWVFLFVF